MRLRNVKNKEEIMNNSSYLIRDYEGLKGNWKSLFKNDNPIYLEIGMGKGKLQAGGNIIAKFLENVEASAGGYVQTESILHSNVSAEKYIDVDYVFQNTDNIHKSLLLCYNLYKVR